MYQSRREFFEPSRADAVLTSRSVPSPARRAILSVTKTSPPREPLTVNRVSLDLLNRVALVGNRSDRAELSGIHPVRPKIAGDLEPARRVHVGRHRKHVGGRARDARGIEQGHRRVDPGGDSDPAHRGGAAAARRDVERTSRPRSVHGAYRVFTCGSRPQSPRRCARGSGAGDRCATTRRDADRRAGHRAPARSNRARWCRTRPRWV